jgi:ABC-type multidrug transport system fused ATPase/permease subunit
LASLRNKIGIVSQNIFLFNDTILDNIKYSRADATIEDVIDAARASGAHEFIARLPCGYNTNAGEIGKRLSAGEKQRISIARAILKNPDVIIFDEPTAHLDNITVKVIYESMKELFKYRTCIIISHHLIDIAWVDHVIVLEDGKISQDGKHEDLINKIGRYHELFQG